MLYSDPEFGKRMYFKKNAALEEKKEVRENDIKARRNGSFEKEDERMNRSGETRVYIRG